MSAEYVKIIERSFQGYTGMLGDIEFKDGISVDKLGRNQIDRLSAAMRVTTVDGESLGIAARLVQNKGTSAPSGNIPVSEPAKPEAKAPADHPQYSRQQLEEIADIRGIVGLREIGDSFGVKGRSVMDLITEIMKAQQGFAPEPEPVVEQPAPVEPAE